MNFYPVDSEGSLIKEVISQYVIYISEQFTQLIPAILPLRVITAEAVDVVFQQPHVALQ
jgi:hypothetical protein